MSYMSVPMGMGYNMIKINNLSKFMLENLLKDSLTFFCNKKFDEYKIDKKKAIEQAKKVKIARNRGYIIFS